MSLTYRMHKNEAFLSGVGKELKKRYGPVIDEFDFDHAEQVFKGQIRYVDHKFTVICAIAPVSGLFYQESAQNNATIVLRQGPESKPLTKAVIAEVQRRLDVTWAPFIQIRVNDRLDSFDRMLGGAALEISYEFLLVGTRADGTKCHRAAVPATETLKGDSSWNIVAGGLYSQQAVHDGDGSRKDCSLVPYTPELGERLDLVIEALHALAAKVSGILTNKDPAKVTAALMGANLLSFTPLKKGKG